MGGNNDLEPRVPDRRGACPFLSPLSQTDFMTATKNTSAAWGLLRRPSGKAGKGCLFGQRCQTWAERGGWRCGGQSRPRTRVLQLWQPARPLSRCWRRGAGEETTQDCGQVVLALPSFLSRRLYCPARVWCRGSALTDGQRAGTMLPPTGSFAGARSFLSARLCAPAQHRKASVRDAHRGC